MAQPPVIKTNAPARRVNPMAVTLVLFVLGLVLALIGAFGYTPLYDLPAGFDRITSCVVLLLLLIVHGFLLKDRGRALPLLLLLYCFFLVPTALALSVGGVLTLNGLFDESEPTHHVALVLSARGVRSGTGPGEPYKLVQVKSWRDGDPDPWIEVHKLLYDSVKPGETKVGVVTRRGWLGIEWIVEVHPEEQ